MKKLTALLLSLLLVLCAAFAAAEEDFTGTWHLVAFAQGGTAHDPSDAGMEITMELLGDGTVQMISMGQEISGTWEQTEDGVTLAMQGSEPVVCSYAEGLLVASGDGIELSFARDDAQEPDEGKSLREFLGTWSLDSITSGDIKVDAAERKMKMTVVITEDRITVDSVGKGYEFADGVLKADTGKVYTLSEGMLACEDDGVTMLFKKTAEPEPAVSVTYSYRLDSVYYTRVNGVLAEEPDKSEMGETVKTTEASLTLEAPEPSLEGYVLSAELSVLSNEFTDPEDETLFIAVYVKDITEYSYRLDSVYYTRVNGVMAEEPDKSEMGETVKTTEASLTLEAPEPSLEGYTLSEGLSVLTNEFTDPEDEALFIAVYVKDITEYSYRLDSVYYTRVNGVMSEEPDKSEMGETVKTTEASLTLEAPASSLEDYVLSEGLSGLSKEFTDADEEYVFTAVYVKDIAEYTYRVDCEYYTEINGVSLNEIDLRFTGDEQKTRETSLSPEAPSSLLKGYAFREDLSDAELTFDNTNKTYVFKFIYIRSITEYTYRTDSVYYTRVDGVLADEPDITLEGEELKTRGDSLEVSAPESAYEEYAYDPNNEENVLSLSFDDADTVYVRETSLFRGIRFIADTVTIPGDEEQAEDMKGEISIFFNDDGTCELKLLGREMTLDWTYEEGLISVDYFGDTLEMRISETGLEADMAGMMDVVFVAEENEGIQGAE